MREICERMIASRITNHLLQNKIIDPKNLQPICESQIDFSILHFDIRLAILDFALGFSLDIQAAYDSMYIEGLILKCTQFGIVGTNLSCLHRFLSCRRIRVPLSGIPTSPRTIGRGVPQGVVLKPHSLHYFFI